MKKKLLLLALFFLVPMQTWAIDYSLHGYYRFIFNFSHDLDTQTPSNIAQGNQLGNDRFGGILFGQQRLRLEPTIKINDNISIHGQVDVLDNVLFGQNAINSLGILNPIAGTLTLPGGAGSFGTTGDQAGDVVSGGGGSLNVRRLYVDILTPMGKFRIGRQPSHWGLGIVSNDGNGRYSKFGDTFDRFLWMGAYDFNDTSSLAFGLIADFAFTNQGDPQIDLLEGAVGSIREGTYQLASFLLYQRPNLDIGVFGGVRLRGKSNTPLSTAIDATGTEVPGATDGDTTVWFVDAYGKWQKGPITIKAEYAHLGGDIATGVCVDAIQVPAGFTNPVPNPICLNGTNSLNVNMGALEVEGKHDWGGEWKLMAGFAQGDSNPLSSEITQFGFRPDYDIALMMFNMPLGTSPAVQVNGDTKLGNVPITGNQVNNAIYVGGTYMHKWDISKKIPQGQYFKAGVHFMTAWAPSKQINLNFAEITGIPTLPTVVNNSKWYGFETDLIVEAKFFEHLTWNITGGVFIPGGVFDIKNDDAANSTFTGNPLNAIIFDSASPAYAVRSTLFLEF